MGNAYDALLGRIQSNGQDLELEGAINFTGGLIATPNPQAKRIDVRIENLPVATKYVALTANVPGATFTMRPSDTRTTHLEVLLTEGTTIVLQPAAGGAVYELSILVSVGSENGTVSIRDEATDSELTSTGLSARFDLLFDGTKWRKWFI